MAPAATAHQERRRPKTTSTLVPKDTDVVFMVNVKQARKSPLWDKFVDKFNQDPKAKADYDEVVKKCQIDPLKAD